MPQGTLTLPQNLDLVAAGVLRQDLLALRGAPIVIDAGNVQRFGALCLQVLVAAKREWDAAGYAFQVTARSRDFEESARLMGASALFGLTMMAEAGARM
jgi:chemotaxis protein CheX